MNHLCAFKVGKRKGKKTTLWWCHCQTERGRNILYLTQLSYSYSIFGQIGLFRAAPKGSLILAAACQTWRGLFLWTFFKDFLQGFEQQTTNGKHQTTEEECCRKAYYLRKKHRFFSPRARRCSRGAEKGHVYTVVAGHHCVDGRVLDGTTSG
jgi:hypothetical protein